MNDFTNIRDDFPIFKQKVHGNKPLTFLDSTASAQKPKQVIDAMVHAYQEYYANIHRGVYAISEKGTAEYGKAKRLVADFINARDTSLPVEDGHEEIIFTRNTTESINLVAYSWGRQNIQQGDEIVITIMEHHSNMVPWQELAKEKGAVVRYVDIDDEGFLRLDQLESLLNHRTKIVAVTHMSNVLGTINPVKEIGEMAHHVGAKFLVDGAQSVPHLPIDVQDINCDFLAFSGHKMLGPSAIGVLYGKRELLEEMPPFLYGGDMIRKVTLEGARWNSLPWKFEAGTPPIVEGIGLGAAVDYLSSIGMDNINQHERKLTDYMLESLNELDGLSVYGPPASHKGGIASFTIAGMHAHDIGSLLDREGICVRVGTHCAMPLHQRLGIVATVRASLYLYNTRNDIERLIDGLKKAKSLFD